MALYRVPAVLVALVFHEFAHGLAAFWCGDSTARERGRLTLNPLPHLDVFGTLMLLVAGFGWAKPVPVNPTNFRHRRLDDFLVSIAGITMNLLIFSLSTVVLIIVDKDLWTPMTKLLYPIEQRMSFSGALGFVMYGEIAGLKQYGIGIADMSLVPVARFAGFMGMLNISIAVFNLIPIPPLDGSHVLADAVGKPELFYNKYASGIGIVLLLLMTQTNWLGRAISFVADNLQALFFRFA
ncbi:MAG: site-2 protease family protein [Oscillospiraceae bacterium]|nr:site-2 protease family protein [Oscillospiraceae bacterium]